MTPEIRRISRQIRDVGRRAYEQGLVAAAEGNLSARLSDGTLLCTPSGVCKGRLRRKELVRTTAGGEPTDPLYVPSSELGLHVALYQAAPSIGAVVHAHPPFATTFAVLGETLPCGVLAEGELFLGDVPLIPYLTPGTPAVGAAVAAHARSAVAALLSNHGAVTWGATLEEAYLLMETLESVSRVVYLARLLGGGRPIGPGLLEALRSRRNRTKTQTARPADGT